MTEFLLFFVIMAEILKAALVMTTEIRRGERAMALKIVRNDITKMNTEAIVNTANENPVVGPGVDTAVYIAAGFDELLKYRKEHIGHVPGGKLLLHRVSVFRPATLSMR